MRCCGSPCLVACGSSSSLCTTTSSFLRNPVSYSPFNSSGCLCLSRRSSPGHARRHLRRRHGRGGRRRLRGFPLVPRRVEQGGHQGARAHRTALGPGHRRDRRGGCGSRSSRHHAEQPGRTRCKRSHRTRHNRDTSLPYAAGVCPASASPPGGSRAARCRGFRSYQRALGSTPAPAPKRAATAADASAPPAATRQEASVPVLAETISAIEVAMPPPRPGSYLGEYLQTGASRVRSRLSGCCCRFAVGTWAAGTVMTAEPLVGDSATKARRRSIDAVTLLSVYLLLLVGVPQRLVFAPIGAAAGHPPCSRSLCSFSTWLPGFAPPCSWTVGASRSGSPQCCLPVQFSRHTPRPTGMRCPPWS